MKKFTSVNQEIILGKILIEMRNHAILQYFAQSYTISFFSKTTLSADAQTHKFCKFQLKRMIWSLLEP